MTMQLVLIRHGETQWNRERRSQGQTDTVLTELGCKQGELVAQSLRDEEVVAVYTSPLTRARDVAERIARLHDLDVIERKELMELHHGDLEGMTGDDMREKHGPFLEEWLKAPAKLKLPNGESLEELQQRTWRFVEEVRAAHRVGTVVAVSHNLALRTILCKALGMDLNYLRRMRQDPACKNVLEFRDDHIQVVMTNCTCHLHPLKENGKKPGQGPRR